MWQLKSFFHILFEIIFTNIDGDRWIGKYKCPTWHYLAYHEALRQFSLFASSLFEFLYILKVKEPPNGNAALPKKMCRGLVLHQK